MGPIKSSKRSEAQRRRCRQESWRLATCCAARESSRCRTTECGRSGPRSGAWKRRAWAGCACCSTRAWHCTGVAGAPDYGRSWSSEAEVDANARSRSPRSRSPASRTLAGSCWPLRSPSPTQFPSSSSVVCALPCEPHRRVPRPSPCAHDDQCGGRADRAARTSWDTCGASPPVQYMDRCSGWPETATHLVHS